MKLTYKNNADTFILGSDKRCFVSTDSYKTKLNNNIMVVGGSGSGKTRGVVLPTCLNMQNENAVIILSKEGEFAKVKEFMKSQGYNIYTLNFKEPENLGYDPLKYCENLTDVRDLAHSIMWAGCDENNPPKDLYWVNAPENILYLTLAYVWRGCYSEGKSLNAALKLLDSLVWLEKSEKDFVVNVPLENCKLQIAICDFIKEIDDEEKTQNLKKICNEINMFIKEREVNTKEKSLIYYEFAQNLKEKLPELSYIWEGFISLPDVTGSCIANCLKTPIEKMFTNDVREILKKENQFELEKLLEPKTVLFVHVSPVSRAQHNFVGIFYAQLFKKLFEMAEKEPSSRLPHHVEVIGDDFATGCKIPDYQDLISIFREKNIGAMMLIQSETQLSSLYGKENAATIINNCDTYVYLGGMDIKTCENISKRMNLPYSDIQNMKIGSEFFIRRGTTPFQTKAYDIESDILYQTNIKENKIKEKEKISNDLSYY